MSHRRRSSQFVDPFSGPEIYYGPENDPQRRNVPGHKTRTMSIIEASSATTEPSDDALALRRTLRRRASMDMDAGNRQFIITDVDATLKNLLEAEDTDNNNQITIEDAGPKVVQLGTANSNGYNKADIRGTYMLSNLLQELTLAKMYGRKRIIIDEVRLNENPVDRLSRVISTQFWNNLTRRLDAASIAKLAADSKIKTPYNNPRIYIPHGLTDQYEFFVEAAKTFADVRLEVEYLPEKITPDYVKSINDRPGLLTLAMEKCHDPVTGEETLRGYPYVVPGGRFNEQYGWDSYMETLGLLVNHRVDLARGMVENFIFEITYYGKILNANRSYYLCRSQPPFLTDMALRIFEQMRGGSAGGSPGGSAGATFGSWGKNKQTDWKTPGTALNFLYRATVAAIKEYETVWCAAPRLDDRTGLSCYHPDGLGIPPETEPSHFDSVLKPYAEKHGISIEEFSRKYNDGEISEPDLDEYFLHDRAVRESGHDTTYRLEGRCANLATIDLNSLLFKYETDLAYIVRVHFGDKLELPDGRIVRSSAWDRRSRLRRDRVNKYCWNEEKGMYFDYDVKQGEQSTYESATTFWALWAGLSSPRQAAAMVQKALPKFEMFGGIVAGTEESRGPIGLDRPNRQWDYPYGWAPQQMLTWIGFMKYGYVEDTERLVYRWLYLMTKAFVDYNGIVVEKYDVTRPVDPHRVDAEYGNQGAGFKGVATEGFGWVNASYVFGLTFLNSHARRALGTCTPPDVFFSSEPLDDDRY